MTEYIKYIKNNINIVDAVERAGITLKSNKACCPFHHDIHPSLSVHPQKNIFKCFSCGISGDVIEFVKQFYNTDCLAAMKLLNDNFSLGLNFNIPIHANIEQNEDNAIEQIVEQAYLTKFKRFETAILKYHRKLHYTINKCKISFEIADFPDEYIKAVKKIDIVNYYCDVMAFGSFDEKKKLICSKEVKKIEQEFKY